MVGARPNFIKLAPLSRALRRRTREIVVHTDQHYDAAMSADLFRELGLPEPDHHLDVGSGSGLDQIARTLQRLEPVLTGQPLRAVIVYGDTNSTLGGALAAAKLGIPVAHVEAGLRSFDRGQPEESNRILVDRLSRWLFAPTETAVRNLAAEGLTDRVHLVGDVMLDAVREHSTKARLPPALGLEPRRFYYVTMHRPENVDRPETLREMVAAVSALDRPAVLPVHPRTRRRLGESGIPLEGAIVPIEPVGYLESLALIRDARAVLTDSGGVLRESFFLGTPSVTLRDRTEWPETLTQGRNVLGGARRDSIGEALRHLPDPERPPTTTPFGDGHAAERIAALLCD